MKRSSISTMMERKELNYNFCNTFMYSVNELHCTSNYLPSVECSVVDEVACDGVLEDTSCDVPVADDNK